MRFYAKWGMVRALPPGTPEVAVDRGHLVRLAVLICPDCLDRAREDWTNLTPYRGDGAKCSICGKREE